MSLRQPLFVLCLALLAPFILAQDEQPQESPFKAIAKAGPFKARLGGSATINVPETYQFIDQAHAGQFYAMTQNTADGNELGILLSPDGAWFADFTFDSVGYVKDDEKDDLDADAMLESMREATNAQNVERKKRGWPEFTLDGWAMKPYFDDKTKNLTWSKRISSVGGGSSINHTTKILGRRGVMIATLVVSPEDYAKAKVDFDKAVEGFGYVAGDTYAEYRSGDKVAEYGLTALIVGGGIAAAAKTGLLGKFLKPILAGIAAIVAGIAKLWSKITGKKRSTEVAGGATRNENY